MDRLAFSRPVKGACRPGACRLAAGAPVAASPTGPERRKSAYRSEQKRPSVASVVRGVAIGRSTQGRAQPLMVARVHGVGRPASAAVRGTLCL